VILLPWIWYQVWSQTWQPSGFVLGIGLLIGIPLLSPFLVQQACGSVRIKRFGFGYSLKSLGLQLQTTSVAVASLAVAVSMLIGITLMIGSFRKTLEVWVATSIQADIYVTPRSWRGKGAESTLDPEIVRAMAAHPGVAAVDRLRAFLGYTGEQRISIAGVEMGLVGGAPRFPLLEGEPPEVFRQVREEGKVLVGETLARKRGLAVGEELPLYGREGELRLEIAGVYYDYSTEGGIAVMDLTTMARHFGPGPVNSVALYLAPGYDPERVLDELKARFPEAPLLMRSNRRLRAEISKVFEETFAVTRILQFMSLAIATCGVALTLLVLARERISELALYRALGAGRRQLFNIFVWKGLAMGFLGLTLGLLGGLALAGVLIFVINRAYFGWTIQVYWPWRDLLQEIASIVGAAGIASLYPALRASRTPARELSRDDI
jgi:putative ABC transport system permease protein